MDCEHLLDPLPLEHHAVDDGWIQSLAYDRVTQCLEVRFKWPWHNVHQYRPVPPKVVREIWKRSALVAGSGGGWQRENVPSSLVVLFQNGLFRFCTNASSSGYSAQH